MKKFLFGLLLAAFLSPCSAQDEQANARSLASAVHEYMIATYGCQRQIGGLSMYRSAKQTAENTFVQMGVDRNQAVMLIAQGDTAIKRDFTPEMLEGFKEHDGIKITAADRTSGCLKTISDAQDNIKLLKAKLGLLK